MRLIESVLLSKLSKLYYEFGHMERKIDRQFEMHYSAFSATAEYSEERRKLITAIIMHCRQELEPTKEMIELLETEINKIGCNTNHKDKKINWSKFGFAATLWSFGAMYMLFAIDKKFLTLSDIVLFGYFAGGMVMVILGFYFFFDKKFK